MGDVVSPAAVDGVEFQEVSGALGGGIGIIDADELEIGIVKSGAEDEAADSAKSINGNGSGHGGILPDGWRMKRRKG